MGYLLINNEHVIFVGSAVKFILRDLTEVKGFLVRIGTRSCMMKTTSGMKEVSYENVCECDGLRRENSTDKQNFVIGVR